MIPVELSYAGESIAIWALVDSGADISVFHPQVAEALGISFQDAPVMQLERFGADAAQASLIEVYVRIGEVRVAATIGFSEHVPYAEGLLGRHRVFDQIRFGFLQAGEMLLYTPEIGAVQ